MKTYIAYYYDASKVVQHGFDTNELSVNGKFLSDITSVRTSNNIADLIPRTENEELILLTPIDTELDVENFNPCPEDR